MLSRTTGVVGGVTDARALTRRQTRQAFACSSSSSRADTTCTASAARLSVQYRIALTISTAPHTSDVRFGFTTATYRRSGLGVLRERVHRTNSTTWAAVALPVSSSIPSTPTRRGALLVRLWRPCALSTRPGVTCASTSRVFRDLRCIATSANEATPFPSAQPVRRREGVPFWHVVTYREAYVISRRTASCSSRGPLRAKRSTRNHAGRHPNRAGPAGQLTLQPQLGATGDAATTSRPCGYAPAIGTERLRHR